MDHVSTPVPKRPGRRPKGVRPPYVLDRDRKQFILDLSTDNTLRELAFNLLIEANNKSHGREVTFQDLASLALGKLTPKDIARLQDNSLTAEEKYLRALDQYNQKHGTKLTLDQFLHMKLGIN